MTITTTKTTQSANEVLGTEEKTLYYLIIKNNKDEKIVINVGKKTHDEVQKLNQNETETENNNNAETKRDDSLDKQNKPRR